MNKHILELSYVILLSTLFLTMGSCTKQSPAILPDKKLLEMISNIDSWPESSTNYTDTGWLKLVLAAKVLQNTDPSSAAKTFEEYQNAQVNSYKQALDDGKICLLLRIAYALPEASTNINYPFFAGWATMHSEYNENGTVNLAWPLSWNNGNPRLTSGFSGLEGIDARYKSVDEYNYFRIKYPLRDLSGFKNESNPTRQP